MSLQNLLSCYQLQLLHLPNLPVVYGINVSYILILPTEIVCSLYTSNKRKWKLIFLGWGLKAKTFSKKYSQFWDKNSHNNM